MPLLHFQGGSPFCFFENQVFSKEKTIKLLIYFYLKESVNLFQTAILMFV
jgi:hypothetical protein